jgi:hypothetical protein
MKGNWHKETCMKCWGVGGIAPSFAILDEDGPLPNFIFPEAWPPCPECAGKGYRIWIEGEPALDIESVELP